MIYHEKREAKNENFTPPWVLSIHDYFNNYLYTKVKIRQINIQGNKESEKSVSFGIAKACNRCKVHLLTH